MEILCYLFETPFQEKAAAGLLICYHGPDWNLVTVFSLQIACTMKVVLSLLYVVASRFIAHWQITSRLFSQDYIVLNVEIYNS